MSIKGEASEIHQNPEAPARRNWILRCGGCRTPIYPSICLGVCVSVYVSFFSPGLGAGGLLPLSISLSLACLLACLLGV